MSVLVCLLWVKDYKLFVTGTMKVSPYYRKSPPASATTLKTLGYGKVQVIVDLVHKVAG